MRPPPSLRLVQALVHGSLRVEAAGTLLFTPIPKRSPKQKQA